MRKKSFSHDSDAMSDEKIVELRRLYRMEGYGVYWAIVEAMSREPTHSIEMSESKVFLLAERIQPSFDLGKFIEDCIRIGLFRSDGLKFWSETLRKRVEKSARASDHARIAAQARWGKTPSEEEATEPPITLDLLPMDSDWMRVARAYESQLEMLPFGKSLDDLMAYYDSMGAEIMIFAIGQTKESHPASPYPYLMSILKAYAKRGFTTVQQCEEYTEAFKARKKQIAQMPQQQEQQPKQTDEPRWLD